MGHRSNLSFVVGLVACVGCSSSGTSVPGSASSVASGSASPHKRPAGSASGAHVEGSSSPSVAPVLTLKPTPFPGASAPTFIDYFVSERGASRLWVPMAATGSVDVFDAKAGTFARIDGFATAELVRDGKKRPSGPNAISIGDGFAYVGNRATNEVCAIDMKTLKVGACLKVVAQTDAVSYVASQKELWVTTPRDSSITVLDASNPAALKPKTVIKLAGQPEGFAIDTKRNLFYTNLEDKGSTLAIDIKTHQVIATWNPDCGENGPRGLALDIANSFVFVSCTDHVQALDGGHQGAYLGKFDTGAGVDKIDYREEKRLLYAASGKAGRLSVLSVDDKGLFTVAATAPLPPGARSVVVDEFGIAYVADTTGAELLVSAAMP